ncbi:DinB family protein [Sphingobacterium sp. N143]|uniref:DinB family protein n=1 Tax=Sphingobacterium sp. N143 TaxID=2746727 RepID=UPI002575AE86|nr:DinB family protein [Sphingobacterium sp. N143]MDM1294169.1 DinB family protein [Sphingobacterium sp. N143]
MENLEVWMRGPVSGIPDLLQPVAHALLQVEEDANKYVQNLAVEQLWERPYGNASIGFHLQHISGVIDRMFTYADGKSLSAQQFDDLDKEGRIDYNINSSLLLEQLHVQIDRALTQLALIVPNTLTETRFLGRKRIPTTLIGLLFHAAEHAQRHIGQLLVTVRCLNHK